MKTKVTYLLFASLRLQATINSCTISGLKSAYLALFFLILSSGHVFADISLDELVADNAFSERLISLLVLVAVLSMLPALLVMVTCFPFIITVLAILRQALGLQQSPPNILLIGIATFLTYFVMEPVFDAAWRNGAGPYIDGSLPLEDAWQQTLSPFRDFMAERIDASVFTQLSALRAEDFEGIEVGAAQLSVLVPSFMLSELSEAFKIGFLIFLPFLIIDLVVAAFLMSMGMMMVPPAIVSLPFKLAFFVVADGWAMLSYALVGSYN